MLNPLSYENRTKGYAPFLVFSFFVLAHLLAMFIVIRYFFNGIWVREMALGASNILLLFVVCHLIFSFGEFFFHRYILHMPIFENTISFYKKHTGHHALTSIHFEEGAGNIKSHYPIESVERDAYGTFPIWALLALLVGFAPLLILLGFLLPQIPITSSGLMALTLSYYLYEVIHVTHHNSYLKWWAPRIGSKLFGGAWQKMYGFHQAHHANIKCNMAVAGFFGLPIADIIFGTYKQPDKLLIDGVPAEKNTIQKLTPKPRWPVSRLDSLAIKRKTRIMKELSEKNKLG